MPYLPIPRTAGQYALIAFDSDGVERTDDPAGLMSQSIAESIESDSITDVFLVSHGWMGDLLAAQQQYDAWIGLMASCATDQARAAARDRFRPLAVGVHWPSLPWGDEEFDVAAARANPAAVEASVSDYAARLADTPAARQSLRTIFATAVDDPNPNTLPADVRAAYADLNREAGLESQGVVGAPGADREPFDAEDRFQQVRAEAAISFDIGQTIRDLVLAPLRELSFWKMKDRARRIGEVGVRDLLRSLVRADAGPRIHLSGHSFGAIVVSGALAGPQGGQALPAPVHSLVLLQGALSLWAYCSEIPPAPGHGGYFRRLIDHGLVSGPIVTTRSAFDLAVGRWYPRGAGVAGEYAFAKGELPKYGGVGTFGAQGPGLQLVEMEILPADQAYNLGPRTVTNLECSGVIRNGDGLSGAHCDIVHPQLAHAVWSAALA
jgi:hypothetical protein